MIFHIWVEIEAVFHISNFSNSRHSEVAINFLSEVKLEVDYANKIAMNIFDILSFWSML